MEMKNKKEKEREKRDRQTDFRRNDVGKKSIFPRVWSLLRPLRENSTTQSLVRYLFPFISFFLFTILFRSPFSLIIWRNHRFSSSDRLMSLSCRLSTNRSLISELFYSLSMSPSLFSPYHSLTSFTRFCHAYTSFLFRASETRLLRIERRRETEENVERGSKWRTGVGIAHIRRKKSPPCFQKAASKKSVVGECLELDSARAGILLYLFFSLSFPGRSV